MSERGKIVAALDKLLDRTARLPERAEYNGELELAVIKIQEAIFWLEQSEGQ